MRKLFLPLILASALPFTLPVSAHDNGDSNVNEALLEEIRMLRRDLQRVMTSHLRASLLIERVRIESELVRELSRELDQRRTNRRYQDMEEQLGWAEQHEEDLERRLTLATGDERLQIERELEMLERRVKMEERRRLEEQDLTMELQQNLDEATARLDQLFEEIASLERELKTGSNRQ